MISTKKSRLIIIRNDFCPVEEYILKTCGLCGNCCLITVDVTANYGLTVFSPSSRMNIK